MLRLPLEQADTDCAEYSAAKVDGGSADRIVDMDTIEKHDSEDDDDAGNSADQKRDPYSHICAACRDRDKSCKASVDRHAEVGLSDEYPCGNGRVSTEAIAEVFAVMRICITSEGF